MTAGLARVWARAWQFDPPRTLSAQMELLSRNLVLAFGGSSLAALLMGAVYWQLFADDSILLWALGTVLVGLGGMGARYWLPSHTDLCTVQAYARQVRWLVLLLGACWGGLCWHYMRPDTPETILLIMAITAGVNSGGLALFSASWPVSVAFWLTFVLPSIFVLLPAGGVLNMGFGLATLTYLVVMLSASYHAARTTLRSIALRFENAELVQRLQDQTARAQDARSAAEAARGEAEQANRAKSKFLAAASHDLRQPLHALGLFLQALAETPLASRQQQLLAHVQASSDAASDMLNTMLDFSKVDAGVVTSRARPVAIQPLLLRMEREFAPQANQRGLAFRLRDSDLTLHADPQLLELVLRNLVTNAIRYTERGGVLLACRRRGTGAELQVWDTGVGIASDQHEVIFQEFHQLANPERDRRKGLGLGLAIVAGLVRAMGARIRLSSVPGRGSVFRLALPLWDGRVLEPTTSPKLAAELVPQLSPCRVLLIDDDESVRTAMADLLAAWGCPCVTVPCEDTALAAVDRFAPDVIVADYRLRQHRTGREAIETLRARLGRQVPALIITGDTAVERLREAMDGGVLLLHKPVGALRLQQAIATLLHDEQVSRVGLPQSWVWEI